MCFNRPFLPYLQFTFDVEAAGSRAYHSEGELSLRRLPSNDED